MVDYLTAGLIVVLVGVVEEEPVVGYILQPSDLAALIAFKGVAVCPTFQPGYRRDGRDSATVTDFTSWMNSKKHKLNTAEGRASAKAALCAPGAPLFTLQHLNEHASMLGCTHAREQEAMVMERAALDAVGVLVQKCTGDNYSEVDYRVYGMYGGQEWEARVQNKMEANGRINLRHSGKLPYDTNAIDAITFTSCDGGLAPTRASVYFIATRAVDASGHVVSNLSEHDLLHCTMSVASAFSGRMTACNLLEPGGAEQLAALYRSAAAVPLVDHASWSQQYFDLCLKTTAKDQKK
jgi:hypothetical protein